MRNIIFRGIRHLHLDANGIKSLLHRYFLLILLASSMKEDCTGHCCIQQPLKEVLPVARIPAFLYTESAIFVIGSNVHYRFGHADFVFRKQQFHVSHPYHGSIHTLR